MMRIDARCRQCQAPISLALETPEAKCPHCQTDALPHATDAFKKNRELNQCPLCGCAHLYRQKDFNRKTGLVLLALGIGLAYFTYGVSLLIVTVMDFALSRWVGEVGVCYQCGGLFRGDDAIARLGTFELTLHDYYRNLKSAALPNRSS